MIPIGEVAAKVAETVEKISETSEKIDEVVKIKETYTYKDIKPDREENINEVDEFWNNIFSEDKSFEELEVAEKDNVENDLEKVLDEYFQNLKDKSECSDTIEARPFELDDLEKQLPEKISEMRDQFDDLKTELKRRWEEKYGRSWPKYEHDIYSSNGKLIRKAGSDYDAHHIQPLAMGGKNEVTNITPLNAEVHYDKQGVHSPDSPYSRMDKILERMD